MRKTIDAGRRDTHPRWRDDGQDDGDGRRDQHYWRHYHREDGSGTEAAAKTCVPCSVCGHNERGLRRRSTGPTTGREMFTNVFGRRVGWYRSCSARFTKRQVPPSRGNDDRCMRRDNILLFRPNRSETRSVQSCAAAS